MEQHLIVSLLQHSYSIQVPQLQYFEDLKKLKEDKGYIRKVPASFETVLLTPGVNRISKAIFDRLSQHRAFKGLIENNSIKVDDLNAEEAYRLKLDPKYKTSKEYLETKKQVELELKNKEQEKIIADLKESQQLLQLQIDELNQLVKGEDKNDNSHKHKGAVS